MAKNRADAGVEQLEEEIKALEAEAGVTNNSPDEEENTEETSVEPKSEESSLIPKKEVEEKPLTKEEETYKKRYADLRSHAQKKENSLKERIEELENSLSNNTAQLPVDPDQVKAWVEKYPQVAQVISALADEKVTTKSKALEDKLREIEERNILSNKKEGELKIREVHSDFDKILEKDEFHDWVNSQPTRVQDMIYDNPNPDEVIWGISLYKKSLDKTPPEKETAKSVSTRGEKSTPSTDGGKPRFSESQVNKMSLAEFEKNEDAIFEAQRSGTFLYDMTGEAR